MIQYGSICEHYKKYKDCKECSKHIKCPCGRPNYKCDFCKKMKENGWIYVGKSNPLRRD